MLQPSHSRDSSFPTQFNSCAGGVVSSRKCTYECKWKTIKDRCLYECVWHKQQHHCGPWCDASVFDSHEGERVCRISGYVLEDRVIENYVPASLRHIGNHSRSLSSRSRNYITRRGKRTLSLASRAHTINPSIYQSCEEQRLRHAIKSNQVRIIGEPQEFSTDNSISYGGARNLDTRISRTREHGYFHIVEQIVQYVRQFIVWSYKCANTVLQELNYKVEKQAKKYCQDHGIVDLLSIFKITAEQYSMLVTPFLETLGSPSNEELRHFVTKCVALWFNIQQQQMTETSTESNAIDLDGNQNSGLNTNLSESQSTFTSCHASHRNTSSQSLPVVDKIRTHEFKEFVIALIYICRKGIVRSRDMVTIIPKIEWTLTSPKLNRISEFKIRQRKITYIRNKIHTWCQNVSSQEDIDLANMTYDPNYKFHE